MPAMHLLVALVASNVAWLAALIVILVMLVKLVTVGFDLPLALALVPLGFLAP